MTDERADPDGIDVLRALAVVMLVVMHAAIAYMVRPVPDLLWVVHDSVSTSTAFDAIFWWTHSTQLPLLFLLAGLFSSPSLAARGPSGFLWRRTCRLMGPYLGGGLVILPLTYYTWATGWLVSGRCTWGEVLRVKFGPDIQEQLYGPAHLWFLGELYVMTVLLAGLAAVWSRIGSTRPSARGRWTSLVVLLGVIGLPLATVVAVRLQVELHLSHPNRFVPIPGRLVYYAAFFAAGCWMGRTPRVLGALRRRRRLSLALATVSGMAAVWLIDVHLRGGAPETGVWALAVLLPALAWSAVLGLLAIDRELGRWCAGPVRSVADAAYTIYLVHLPVLGLAQVGLYERPVPAAVKFGAAAAAGLAASLVVHCLLVRPIGRRLRRSGGARGAGTVPSVPLPLAGR